jgi:hypothetical protein
MGKKCGFTGTSKGASPAQLVELEEKLKALFADGFDEFHHGLCIGADEQAAIIAKRLGFRVIAHPGLPKDPTNMMYRSDFAGNDEMRDPKPFIARDQDIVNEVEHMLATPLTRAEVVRSGTWTTVRYARKVGRQIDLILPPFVPPTWASAPPPKTNAIAGEDAQTPPHMKRGIR